MNDVVNQPRGVLRVDRDTTLFLTLTFASAWTEWAVCWLLARHGATGWVLTAIVIAGSFAPFFSAGLCIGLRDGLAGSLRFYRRGLDWRIGWSLWLISLLLVPLIAFATAGLFEFGIPTIRVAVTEFPSMYLWLLILGGPVGEEFGWAYLSDRLDAHASLAASTATVGLVWATWHAPLFFLEIPGLSQKFVPFIAFLAMALSMRALFSWAYHRGNGSVLANLLMHNGLNVGMSIVLIIYPSVTSNQPRLWCMVGVTTGVAIFLWATFPVSRFGLAGRHRTSG